MVIYSSTQSHAASKDSTTILLFGDSIVAGYGLANDQTLAVNMKKELDKDGRDVKVINGGVSGDTTSDGLNRLEWTLNQYKPDIVIVALGANDMLRGISPQITKTNLDAMLNILKNKKIKTLLTSVQASVNMGLEYRKAFNDIYPDLAKKYNIKLYPFLLEGLYGHPDLMQSDSIHPNSKGAEEIAKKLILLLIQNKDLYTASDSK